MELYDKTGRVRSPSPGELTEPEEDIRALSNEGAEYSNKHTINKFSKPPVVAGSGKGNGRACRKPNTECAEDPESASSEEEGSSIKTVNPAIRGATALQQSICLQMRPRA